MAGDKFNLQVNSWWSSGNASFPINSIASDLAAALANGLAGADLGRAVAEDLMRQGARA